MAFSGTDAREVRQTVDHLSEFLESKACVAPRVMAEITSIDTISDDLWTTVDWDADLWDSHDMHDVASNQSRLTVPSGWGGIWEVQLFAHWEGDGTGKRGGRIQVNGSGDYHIYVLAAGGLSVDWLHAVTMVVPVVLEDGDYVEIEVSQTAGHNLDLENARVEFRYLGPGPGGSE